MMTGSSSSRHATTTVPTMNGMVMKMCLLALAFAPAVRADCYIDNFGNEVCNGLSNGARAGIGIGIAVVVLLLLVALCYSRRRRTQRLNQAYVNQPQPQYPGAQYAGQPYGQQYNYATDRNSYAGQQQYYPPPQGAYPEGGYPQGTYAPPQEPPPTFDGGKPPGYSV